MDNNMDSTVAAVERGLNSKETQLDGLQNKFGLEEEQQFDLPAELRTGTAKPAAKAWPLAGGDCKA